MFGLVILAALLYALLDASDLLPCGDKCLPAMGNLGPLYQRAVNAAQQQMGGAQGPPGPQGQQQQQEAPELPQEPPLDMPFVPPQNPPLTPPQGPEGTSAPRVVAPANDQPEWSAMGGQEAGGHAEESMAEGEIGENAEIAGQGFTEQAQAEAQQVLAAEAQQQSPAAQWGADSAQGGAGTWGAEDGAEVGGIAEGSRGYNAGAGNAEAGGEELPAAQDQDFGAAEGQVAEEGQRMAESQVPPQSQGVAEGTLAQEGQGNPARVALPSAPVEAGAGEAVGGPAGKAAASAGQAELQGELEAGGGAQISDARTAAGASQPSAFGHVAGGVQQLQAEGEARAKAEKQRKKAEGSGGEAQGDDEVPDDAMAAEFRPCIEPGKLADMAAQSSWPYLALLGVRPGFTRQQEALLRGLWAAKATGSVLLLPPFFLSFDSGAMKQTKLQTYLDTDRLVTHMYCSSKSWAVDHLPASILSSLPANTTAANMPALVQALGPAAHRIPAKVVAALSAGASGGAGGDAASVITAWSEKMRDDAAAGKVKLILLDADTPIPFTSRDQQHLRRNGLAAMRPAQPIASLSAHLLHLLRKTHEAQFGELVGFSFAVVHINPDSLAEASAFTAAAAVAPGGGSGIVSNSSSGSGSGSSSSGTTGGSSTDRLLSVLLAVLNPAHTLLYVTIGDTPQRTAILNRLTSASFHITTRDALLRSDRSAASTDAQRFLSTLHPEHEMQAAVEQAVAREAAVFFGPAESSFSSLVSELRCFTRPPLLEGGEGVPMRATVFYDVGPTAVPCRA
ncbi:unnamed protein product [Closterium sp. Yama58-4]|nr:unnamed protein product [Closterium sp. Yama58-4]